MTQDTAGTFGTPNDVALRLEGVAASQPPLSGLLGEAARMLRTIGGTVAKDPANALRARQYRARVRDASATMGVTVRDACALGGVGVGVFGSDALCSDKGPDSNAKTINTENTNTLIQPEPRTLGIAHATRTDAHAPARLVQQNSHGRTPGFTRFYDAYPEGNKSPDCARKWVTMGLEPHTEAVMAGLAAWLACERWKGGVVIHMRGFLDERRWEQTPPAAKAKGLVKAAPKWGAGFTSGVVEQ